MTNLDDTPLTRLSRQDTAFIAVLVQQIQPRWDRAGIIAALDKCAGANPARLALAALTAAADPDSRTPAVIAKDGPHWRVGQTPSHPASINAADPELCTICTKPENMHNDYSGHEHTTREAAAYAASLRANAASVIAADAIARMRETARRASEAHALQRALEPGRFPEPTHRQEQPA